MIKSNKLIRAIAGGIILICSLAFFFPLDRYCYLSKGISVKMFLSDAYKKKLYGKNINDRCYDILPYDTKISGDHNKLGFYGFTSCKKSGFTLTPALVFDEIIYIPTMIYHKLEQERYSLYCTVGRIRL